MLPGNDCMAGLNTKAAAPGKKIKWLQGLLHDDEDSSDATPQSKEQAEKPFTSADKKLKRSPGRELHKAECDTRDEAVTDARKEKQEGDDKCVKKKRHGGSDSTGGEDVPEARLTRQHSESGERDQQHMHRGSDGETHPGKSDVASRGDAKDTDKENKRRKRLKEKAGKILRRKRPHAGVKAKEKADKRETDVGLQLRLPIDPMKAKSAAQRQRRMKKLQARRMATGEHERLAAVKLKRQESLEASRLKRKQREQMRKTQKAPVAADIDAEIKDDGEPRLRPAPLSSEEAKERKQVLAREHRAAIKAKKQRAVELGAPAAPTLKRPRTVGSGKEKWQQRKDEGPHSVGAENGDKTESSIKRRKLDQMKEEPSETASQEPVSAAGSGISYAKPPSENGAVCKKDEEGAEGLGVRHDTKHAGVGGKDVIDPSLSSNENDIIGAQSFSDINTAGVSETQEQPTRKQEACPVTSVKRKVKEEGQMDSPALSMSISADPVKQQDNAEKKISDEKKYMLLDMTPIPRKSTRDVPAVSSASFVIPKRSVQVTVGQLEARGVPRALPAGPHNDHTPLGVRIPVAMKPLASPESSLQLSNRDPIRSRKRTKNLVPVKNSMFSAQDKALMRLARKRNSIFFAAAELSTQLSVVDKKVSATHMAGYDVCDSAGKVLPDLISCLSCASKREMATDKNSFSGSFFGVSLSVPKAKGKTSPTIDKCAGVEGRKKMNCYEELRFERPEDREFYQRRMYGTTFLPQGLRGRTTLVLRSARFERKSTGIRFNQDRDREEFAVSLSKRYTFNKSVPRCDIPRENWQKLMRHQPGTVYLHYNNREDAERASHVFRDDSGNPLELRMDSEAGMVIRRSFSPAPGGISNRIPRRSCSSERSAPEPSPQSSQCYSARNTPHWQRERQRITSSDHQYSRNDGLHSVQWDGREDRYGQSVSGNRLPHALLKRRSRSRSRSRSKSRLLAGQQNGGTGKEAVAVGTSTSLTPEKPKDEMESGSRETLPAGNEVSIGDSRSTIRIKDDGETNLNGYERAALPMAPSFSRRAIQGKSTDIESGEEQEEGEIESSTILVAETTETSEGGGGRKRKKSPLRSWQQSYDEQDHQQHEDYRGRPYEQQHNRGPNRRRSRSRSRPRLEGWAPLGHDDSWDGSYTKERRPSREFEPAGAYDNDGHGRRMYSGEMDRYGGRSYRSGGYSDHRSDRYSGPY